MLEELQALRQGALAELAQVDSDQQLQGWRVRYLGRRGQVSQALRRVGSLPPEERSQAGQAGNRLRAEMEELLASKSRELEAMAQARALERERVDVTLPGRPPRLGQLHPTTRVLREITGVFVAMGFQVVEGPEVEWDYYNFQALNIPKDHPARDMWDTLYIATSTRPGEMLLRTHTSPNQIRVMEKARPPVRVIVPGKCYRYEAVDASHETMFYQVEGLAVGEEVTMADLKGTLTAFAHAVFGRDRRVRFRCDYFPFVEPGAEMAIDCHGCHGAGCRLCKQTGWIEILGAGMVHPKVLEGVGYNPTIYSGFAFGMGPERIAMLKYGIDDIRRFYSNDLRFLSQFK